LRRILAVTKLLQFLKLCRI